MYMIMICKYVPDNILYMENKTNTGITVMISYIPNIEM